eukprot:TRINITY_DN17931_c0_g1_i1.p1 TRINITY_DN17931_c0_g1~~TRINITY_DN17931_c0_g1_i1.p1  ORF type:complete len:699 (+),score=293.06 TRINITY_DN17931_c0_g1_i1:150-2099(+)
MALPKGTEHFMSDIHGEFEAFNHVLRSCSGVIKRHIGEIFASGMSVEEQKDLAALIYYPAEAVENVEENVLKGDAAALEKWYSTQLCNLTAIAQSVSSKYTKKYIRKAIPSEFEHLVQELLQHDLMSGTDGDWTMARANSNKEQYFNTVVRSLVETGMAGEVIRVLADLICRLAVHHLHIVGDIFDRGPAAHDIMEKLCNYHSVDIQWGNHDMLWMGAAAGSEVCMCTTIRIALRYSNTVTLEDAYGIAMFPLSQLALHYYGEDPLAYKIFKPKKSKEKVRTEQDMILLAKMQKAISIIQFKLEAQLIRRHPEYEMDDRLFLPALDKEKGIVVINGKTFELNDRHFPTIDPEHPEVLTPMERSCVDQLMSSFKHSRWLQKHMALLWSHGGMYTVSNNCLLLHGGIPMTSEGQLVSITMQDGVSRKGKAYCDALDKLARQGIVQPEGSAQRQDGLDMLYYLWTGPKSPLFGKDRMTTFERYFIEDKKTHTEPKDPYLKMRHDPAVAGAVLADFGCCPQTGVIVNGHTPVKASKGESPIKAGGRLIVIDGGFSAAYQKETGIAGYTLIANSYGLMLAEHKAFRGRQAAVTSHDDNHARTIPVSHNTKRIRIADTDPGKKMKERLVKLKALLRAYEGGVLRPLTEMEMRAKL